MRHWKWKRKSRAVKKRFGVIELIGYWKVDLWFFYVLIPKREGDDRGGGA